MIQSLPSFRITEQGVDQESMKKQIEDKVRLVKQLLERVAETDGIDFTRDSRNGKMYAAPDFVQTLEGSITSLYMLYSRLLLFSYIEVLEKTNHGDEEGANAMEDMCDQFSKERDDMMDELIGSFNRLCGGFKLNEFLLCTEHDLISAWPRKTNFLQHIHSLATNPMSKGLMGWDENDESLFHIERGKKNDIDKLLQSSPKYNRSDLKSMVNTLRKFGFRVVNSNGTKSPMTQTITGGRLTVTHPLFREHDKLAIMGMKSTSHGHRKGENETICNEEGCTDIVADPEKVKKGVVVDYVKCSFHIGGDINAQPFPKDEISRIKEEMSVREKESEVMVAKLTKERDSRKKVSLYDESIITSQLHTNRFSSLLKRIISQASK